MVLPLTFHASQFNGFSIIRQPWRTGMAEHSTQDPQWHNHLSGPNPHPHHRVSAHFPDFDPRVVAGALVDYLPADPAYWIERAAQAGIMLEGDGNGVLHAETVNSLANKANPIKIVESLEVQFLRSWLHQTPGGERAVAELLHMRAVQSVHHDADEGDDE
jgi:hypothetical protein